MKTIKGQRFLQRVKAVGELNVTVMASTGQAPSKNNSGFRGFCLELQNTLSEDGDTIAWWICIISAALFLTGSIVQVLSGRL